MPLALVVWKFKQSELLYNIKSVCVSSIVLLSFFNKIIFLVCILGCSEHFYGLDCNTPCGHCLNNDVCDNVTGRCPNGCQNQWTEDKCDGGFKWFFISCQMKICVFEKWTGGMIDIFLMLKLHEILVNR